MRVICDTNIWYEFGKNIPDKSMLMNNEFVSTFISIDELSKSYAFIQNPLLVKSAIQAIFKYSDTSKTIYDPPLIHLKKLSDPNYNYDTYNNHKATFDLTEKIAQGLTLSIEIIEKYLEYCNERVRRIEEFTNLFNEKALEIKNRIFDKQKHRKSDTTLINRNFISFLVASVTKTNGLNKNFDWSQIELFENVLKIFFNDLELGAKKMQINDVNDLFLLIYIKPGEKLWTKEKFWIRVINERLNLGHYLFNS